MAKKINTTLYTSDSYDYVCSYSKDNNYNDGFEAIRNEIAEMYEIDVEKVSDDDVYEAIDRWIDLDWDDFRANLEYSNNDTDCVIIGGFTSSPSYANFYGSHRHTIIPRRYNSITNAISDICNFRGNYYLTIKQVNGHLEISQVHHDGTNTYSIHLLNKRGINAGDNADLSLRTYHKSFNGYLF